ncbi:MAG: sulfite exporter TauE/SafE family protein [Pseudomonadota bacterium]
MDALIVELSLTPTQIGYSAIVVIAAYVVRGVAGFGSALVAVPLLVLALPPVHVVPVVIALDLMGSAGQAWAGRRVIDWRVLIPLAPFTLLGIGGALVLFSYLDAATLALALGAFVACFAVYQLLPAPPIRATALAAVPYGALGGLVGTLFGTGGPFYMMYLGLRGLEKSAVRASFAAYFVMDGGVRLAGFAVYGHLQTATLVLFAIGVPAALVGLAIGGRLHTGLGQKQFKQLVSVLLMLSGLALIYKGL